MGSEPITSLMSHAEVCQAVGLRARACRERLKLSRRELSLKSGVSVPTIGRFERQGVTTLSVIAKLATALGILGTLDGVFAVPKYKTMQEFLKTES